VCVCVCERERERERERESRSVSSPLSLNIHRYLLTHSYFYSSHGSRAAVTRIPQVSFHGVVSVVIQKVSFRLERLFYMSLLWGFGLFSCSGLFLWD